jgi:hypothetical protein
MKNKTPGEAVLAKLGRRPVFSKNMEQELIGKGTEVFWPYKVRCQNGGFTNSQEQYEKNGVSKPMASVFV